MSLISANKLAPATGTQVEIGDSGDTISIPAGVTITNSGTANNFGGGKCLQVVQTVLTSSTTTTSTSLTDISGYSVSITPSATSSKVLVMVNCECGNSSVGQGIELSLLRGSTEIYLGDAAGSRGRMSANPKESTATTTSQAVAIVYLDSPSTTSQTTYKMQWATQDLGTAILGACGDDASNDSASRVRVPSSITVMEIGA